MQFKTRKWTSKQIFYYLITFLFLTVMICPDLVSFYSLIHYIRILQNIFSIVAVILLGYYYRNRFFRVTLYLFGVFLLATIINDSNYPSVLYYFSKSFGLIMILHYFHRMEEMGCWRALSDYFALSIYLNTLITIVYPQGFITTQSINLFDKGIYLLGERNQIMPYYLIAITLSKVYFELSGEKKSRVLFLFLSAFMSEFIYRSSTAMIGLTVFILIYFIDFRFLFNRIKDMHWNRQRLLIMGGIIAFLYYLVVIFRIQNYLNDLIFLFFKKDATFSTRTIIWDSALQMINESPVFGYGGTATKYITIGQYVFNCHNIFLQMMLMGGSIMTAMFIWLIILAINNASKIDSRNIQKSYVALLFAFFIMSMTEVYAISLAIFIMFLPIQILNSNDLYLK